MLQYDNIGLLDGPSFDVDANRLLNRSFSLEVGGCLEGNLLGAGYTQTHDLPIQLVVDCDFNGLRIVLSFCIEMNCLAKHLIFLEISGQQQASLRRAF